MASTTSFNRTVPNATDVDYAGISDSMTQADVDLLVGARVRARKAAERKAARKDGDKSPNASYLLIREISASLTDAVSTYTSDDGSVDGGKLADYCQTLADQAYAATEDDSTFMAANFRVARRNIGRLVKKSPTDAS